MGRNTRDNKTQQESGMARARLSRTHLRELLNVLMRSPTSTIREVGFLLMMLVAVVKMNLTAGDVEEGCSRAYGAKASRSTSHGTVRDAVGRHISCTASDEREKAAVFVATAMKDVKAKCARSKSKVGTKGMMDSTESNAAKAKSLRCWAAKMNQNIGQLLDLVAGADARSIAPRYTRVLQFFAKDISTEKAAKALPAAAAALDFMTSLIAGAVECGRQSHTSTPSSETGACREKVYQASNPAAAVQRAVVGHTSLEESVSVDGHFVAGALPKASLQEALPTTAQSLPSFMGSSGDLMAAASGPKMLAQHTQQRCSQEGAVNAHTTTVPCQADSKAGGGSSSLGAEWSTFRLKKHGAGKSGHTTASIPAESEYVPDAPPPERVVTRRPAFILGAEAVTPPLTIGQSEAVITSGGTMKWPRQQGGVSLEDALVLPPGTSLALHASGPGEELKLSDVLVLPSEPSSEVLEGKRADTHVDDSYGGGQIVLDGHVVTEPPARQTPTPTAAPAAPVVDAPCPLSPNQEEPPAPEPESSAPSIESRPSFASPRRCRPSENMARSPSGSPSRGRHRSRHRSRSPAGRPASLSGSLGPSGPTHADTVSPARSASPTRLVPPASLAPTAHRYESPACATPDFCLKVSNGTGQTDPLSSDQHGIAADASSFDDSRRSGAVTTAPTVTVDGGMVMLMAKGLAERALDEDDVEPQVDRSRPHDGASSGCVSESTNEDADALAPMIGRTASVRHDEFLNRGGTPAACVNNGSGGDDGSPEGSSGGTVISHGFSGVSIAAVGKAGESRGESSTANDSRTTAVAGKSAATSSTDGDEERTSFVSDRPAAPTANVGGELAIELDPVKPGKSVSTVTTAAPFDDTVCLNALEASLALEAKTYPSCQNGYGCLAQAKEGWGLSIIGQIADEIQASTQTIALAAFTLGKMVGHSGLTGRVSNEELFLLPAACVLDSLARSDGVGEGALAKAVKAVSRVMLAVLAEATSGGSSNDHDNHDDHDHEQKKRASALKGCLIRLQGRVSRALPSGLYCATPMDYIEVFMEQCGIYDAKTREESDVIFGEAEEIVQYALLDGFLGWMPPSKIACVAFFGAAGFSITFKSKPAKPMAGASDKKPIGKGDAGSEVHSEAHNTASVSDWDSGTGGGGAREPPGTRTSISVTATSVAAVAPEPAVGPEHASAIHETPTPNKKRDPFDCLFGMGELLDDVVEDDTHVDRSTANEASIRTHQALVDRSAAGMRHDEHVQGDGPGTAAYGAIRHQMGMRQRLNIGKVSGVWDRRNNVVTHGDITSKDFLDNLKGNVRWTTCDRLHAGGTFECCTPQEAGHTGGEKLGDYGAGSIFLRPRSDADIPGIAPSQAITGRQQREWWLHWHQSCGL